MKANCLHRNIQKANQAGSLSLCFSVFLSPSSVMMLSHLGFFPSFRVPGGHPFSEESCPAGHFSCQQAATTPQPRPQEARSQSNLFCLFYPCYVSIYHPMLSLASIPSQCLLANRWMQIIRRTVRLHARYKPIWNLLTPGFCPQGMGDFPIEQYITVV